MLLKSFALLFIAVAIVAAQDAAEQPATRTRTAASRRTKLFEESQQQQAEKVTAAGQRRRLVSKTKVAPAARIATTAAPTTTTAAPTTTEAVTEQVFQEPEPSAEEEQSVEEPEAELPAFRPRPAAVPVRTVAQEVASELPAFRPRSRPAARPVIVEEPEEEEEVAPPVRQRPVAGSTRSRTQAVLQQVQQQVSRPQVQVQVAEEAPVILSKDGRLPRTRTSAKAADEPKAPVETIRRYNHENEDGSFTFGYENADGSFKEETRGVDCIVRGKYGYIDPDGIKREFTYQTGNQCVPGQNNNEEELEDESEEDERPAVPARRPNVPARRPNVPAVERRPNVPATVERRPVNIVQQLQNEDEAEDEISQVLNTPTRISRPNNNVAPQRTQVAQPQPQPAPARRPAPQASLVDFDSEIGGLTGQQRAPVAPPRPAPAQRPIFNDDDDDVFIERRPLAPAPQTGTGLRSFSTELIFDRNNNQFQSALQQRIPETNEEISIRERLGGFVFNPQTTTTPAPFTIQRVAPQTAPRPQQIQQTQQQFDNFGGPVVSDQERLRQLQEVRRAELEQQRLTEERQRIAQENRAAQQQPAVTFGAPPPRPQQVQQQQFQQVQQQQQFRAPQPQFQFRPLTASGGAPSFASGQIDSFLSSLQG